MILSKDLFSKIEELEVKDDFEKINSRIDYSKYTLKEKKNFNFRLVLVPLTMLVILAVILPLTGIFNKPGNESTLPDDSVLGEEIFSFQEKQEIFEVVSSYHYAGDKLDNLTFQDLVNEHFLGGKLLEGTVTGYGEYIFGYLDKRTIKEIEKEENYKYYDFLNSEVAGYGPFISGFEYSLYKYNVCLDRGILNKEENEIYIYKQIGEEFLFETENLKLIFVCREILIEFNEEKQMKLLFSVSGEIEDNYYTVSQKDLLRKGLNFGDKYITNIENANKYIICDDVDLYALNVYRNSVYELTAIFFEEDNLLGNKLEAIFNEVLLETVISTEKKFLFGERYELDYMMVKEILKID